MAAVAWSERDLRRSGGELGRVLAPTVTRRPPPQRTLTIMIEREIRVPLFCDIDLAGRIERVEAQLIALASASAQRRRGDMAGFVTRVAGAVASFAEAGSPFNKVAGLGFRGVPSAVDLDAIEQAFAAQGEPVQIELAHLADPAIGELLTARGYRLVSFENVLGRALRPVPSHALPCSGSWV